MEQPLSAIRAGVRDYYGQVLRTKDDLKTGACCATEALPEWLRGPLANIHEEILAKSYGCGSPIPFALEGCTVLDLGCGTGRDCYLLSQLVGPTGQVIGVDMTPEQLEVARRHVGEHMVRFGYRAPNVTFRQSYIEDLGAAGIADDSIDVVVSNCAINLSADKESVFREIFRVLKPGGELYFADVFAGRRIPEALRTDKLMIGECLGGALYVEDFRRMLARLGRCDYRIAGKSRLALKDAEIVQKAGMVEFYSMTVRTFKCDFEDICENYGHSARYLGSIPHCPHVFELDDHHRFETGLPVPICGNTARMLSETRYAAHFRIDGDFSTHYGPFACAPAPAVEQTKSGGGSCC